MHPHHVWIIEMKNGDRWEPTVGCGLTQKDAEHELRRWREDDPNDKFRIKKYLRTKP